MSEAINKNMSYNRNPTGRGGFAAHPENRNNGYWESKHTISFQYKKFLKMTTAELNEFAKLPPEERTIAQNIAYEMVKLAKNNLKATKEITDRTEGKAPQAIDLTSNGEGLTKLLVEFVDGNKNITDTN